MAPVYLREAALTRRGMEGDCGCYRRKINMNIEELSFLPRVSTKVSATHHMRKLVDLSFKV